MVEMSKGDTEGPEKRVPAVGDVVEIWCGLAGWLACTVYDVNRLTFWARHPEHGAFCGGNEGSPGIGERWRWPAAQGGGSADLPCTCPFPRTECPHCAHRCGACSAATAAEFIMGGPAAGPFADPPKGGGSVQR